MGLLLAELRFNAASGPCWDLALLLLTRRQASLGLPGRYHLQRLLTAREEDALEVAPPANTEALEAYAEGTASQLLFLQVSTLDASPDVYWSLLQVGC